MTSHTLTAPDRFPASTTVTVYPRSNWPDEPAVWAGAAPVGSSTTSGTTDANGAVTFTGLTDGTQYLAYAQVNSEHRYVSFKVGSSLPGQVDLSSVLFAGAAAGQVPAWDAVLAQMVPRNSLYVDITRPPYNAVGDGSSHPLSTRYATLAAAQAVYPAATALTEEIDAHALQLAFNNASSVFGSTIFAPRGSYVWNFTPSCNKSNVTLMGEGMGTTKFTLAAGTTALRNALRFNSSLSGTPPRLVNIACRDFTLDGQGGSTSWTAGGIHGTLTFYAVDGLTVQRVEVLNGRDSNINTVGCTRQVIDACHTDTCYWQGASNPINIDVSVSVAGSDAAITRNTCGHTTAVTIATATALANVATYTTSTPHLMTLGQPVKITGCSVAAYNGYWTVATCPTSTTFTVALTSTPANATGGTLIPVADKNIYMGGKNFTRLVCSQNNSSRAFGAISAEVATPGSTDYTVTGNLIWDFWDHGIGLSDHSTPTAAVYFHRGLCANNTIRGVDGTTEFGRPGAGSNSGVLMHGEILRCVDNVITNVLTGVTAGFNAAIDETNYAINDNTIVQAADSTVSAIIVSKNTAGGQMRVLQVRGNQIDGLLTTTGRHGIRLVGDIKHFDVSNNQIRGVGWAGVFLETIAGLAPTFGGIHNNRIVDANSGSNGTLANQVGVYVGASSTDIVLTRNKAYDTRGSKLMTFGLRVETGATNIRSEDDDFTGCLTGEVSDGTAGVGLYRKDYRDPLGLGISYTVDPRFSMQSAAALGSANRIAYVRVTSGGGVISKIGVHMGAVDAGTPGTTDQIAVAVYANSGSGPSSKPGTRKAVSASTTATATALNQVALTASVQVNVGDWLAIGIASNSSTVFGTTPTDGTMATGLCGFQDGAAGAPVPPSTPSASLGTSIRLPNLVGIT